MLILVVVLGIVMAVRVVRRHRSASLESRRRDALLETTDLLLATMRAGYSVTQATAMLADLAPDDVRSHFRTLRTTVESGEPLVSGLARLRDALGPAFRPLLSLLISALRLGVPTERFVSELHVEARNIHRQNGESLARRLAVRLTVPMVLCTLPSFIVLTIVPIAMGAIRQLQPTGAIP